ncbi:MAG: hypothetical protein IPL52_04485 [Flavobacteriales bacterium]|nr:hypothetical protein [Flavobacteriales bacterium]
MSNCSHVRAQGTVADPGEPVISRMCLWNADRATFKQLHLKQRQIKLLNELKLKYPAVVGGQWDVESENVVPVKTQSGSDRGTNAVPAHANSGQGALANGTKVTAAVAASPSRLQEDLRAVLSADQLRAWAELCGGRYSMLHDPSRSPKVNWH